MFRTAIGVMSVMLLASRYLPQTGFAQTSAEKPASVTVSQAEPDSEETQLPQPAGQSLKAMLLTDIPDDQKTFWSRPFRIRARDESWLMPFLSASSLLIGSDRSIEKELPTGKDFVTRSRDFSNVGMASLAGTAGMLYLWGTLGHKEHWQETGLLSGEAFANSLASSYLIKVASGRERPSEGSGEGRFWQGGGSFPSVHAAGAWSIASVLAHEYPGVMTKLLAYGAASAISVSRVTGRQHFASDIFIGSTLGWYTGRQVYRAHHKPELGGAGWEGLAGNVEEGPRNPKNMGSPYVLLDSWIYPAFDRLLALGYASSAFLGERPWSRMECARLLQETGEQMHDKVVEDGVTSELYAVLEHEFAEEEARLNSASNLGASLDSVYVRVGGISGPPLRDGYHFGQTIVNDYGRPYGEGFNAISGLTGHAVAGPLSISIQAEYQHAPAVGSDPASVLQATASADSTHPLQNGAAQVDRLRLLNATIGVTLRNVQVSFGQQSLWLGPGNAGPFLSSNNAEPATMLRIDTVSPYRVPWLYRLTGPARSEFFIARLSGQHWEYSPTLFGPDLTSQPFVHGSKFSFRPTPNLEIGAGFTAQFGGTGNPATWPNFLRSFISHQVGTGRNPAKRLSEFHFSYRMPGLRNWVQVYADTMVIDEYSPLGSSRPAINPGIYFPRVPKLHKMDLRIEGITTDLNVPAHFGAGAFYWDNRYRSGYTNNENLIGSWIGRRGRGGQAWLTYWVSPRTKLQVGYRQNSVDKAFLKGGRLQDVSMRGDVVLAGGWGVSGTLQRENWDFPVLSSIAQSNLTASFQLTFWPRHSKGKLF